MMTNTTKASTSRKDIVTCEVGYVLLGETKCGIWHARMMWRRTGTHDSVDFDWQKVLDREEKLGDVIGFYHTHTREDSNRPVSAMTKPWMPGQRALENRFFA